MDIERPDLQEVDPNVRAYIEALEAEIDRLRKRTTSRPEKAKDHDEDLDAEEPILEPTEPPTTYQVITATASGVAKRTPRHLYTRQRRGGMGVFDLDAPQDEPPAALAIADESDTLLLITNLARGFRLPVLAIEEGEVRSRGRSLAARLDLGEEERLVAMLPIQAQGYVAMVTERGSVRMLRHHVFGEHMRPGATLYDYKALGPLVSACWTPGDSDLFIVTRSGKGIRFSEKLVPPTGGQGIRLSGDDQAVAVTSVYEDSGVFLLGADGKGTIRQMDSFTPNKAPGAGGKLAIHSDEVVGAVTVAEEDDLFIISRQSKIIRFPAAQVPPKDGVVQGVICMTLRADAPAALAVSIDGASRF